MKGSVVNVLPPVEESSLSAAMLALGGAIAIQDMNGHRVFEVKQSEQAYFLFPQLVYVVQCCSLIVTADRCSTSLMSV